MLPAARRFHGQGFVAWLAWLLAQVRGGGDRRDPVNGIRQAMLQALESPGDTGCRHAGQGITHRIRVCGDAKGLWYLRSELMQVLAAQHGEREARRRLDGLTRLFDGAFPSGLHSHRASLR